MKIYLASDHAGFHLKEIVKAFLLGEGYDVEDVGAHTEDPHDDYPDFMSKAAEKIAAMPTDKAILFGGTGQGEALVANRYPHVRAVIFYGPRQAVSSIDVTGKESNDPYEIVSLTRVHNDANVLSLGVRFLNQEEALTAVSLWLTTSFSEEERHKRRLQKIEELEKEINEQY